MASSCWFQDILIFTIPPHKGITVYCLSKCLEAGQWLRCPSDAIYTLDSFQRKKTPGELPNNSKEVKEPPGEHDKATHTEKEMPC